MGYLIGNAAKVSVMNPQISSPIRHMSSKFKKRTHYETLEIPEHATPEEVKTAYINKAKRIPFTKVQKNNCPLHVHPKVTLSQVEKDPHFCFSNTLELYPLSEKDTLHPDSNVHDKELHEKFVRLNEAYKVLSEPERKKRYDDYLNYETLESWQRHTSGPFAARDYHENYNFRPQKPYRRPDWDAEFTRDPDDDSHKTTWQRYRTGLVLFVFCNFFAIYGYGKVVSKIQEDKFQRLVYNTMTPAEAALYFDPQKSFKYKRTSDMFDPTLRKDIEEAEVIAKKIKPQVDQQFKHLRSSWKPLQIPPKQEIS